MVHLDNINKILLLIVSLTILIILSLITYLLISGSQTFTVINTPSAPQLIFKETEGFTSFINSAGLLNKDDSDNKYRVKIITTQSLKGPFTTSLRSGDSGDDYLVATSSTTEEDQITISLYINPAPPNTSGDMLNEFVTTTIVKTILEEQKRGGYTNQYLEKEKVGMMIHELGTKDQLPFTVER